MADPAFIALLLALGGLVGFMAGLLGIGGGGFMVPVLTWAFLGRGAGMEQVVHLALGTSMAAIIGTGAASALAHNRRGGWRMGPLWGTARRLGAGAVAGSFAATFVAARLDTLSLALFFSAFMASVSLWLWFGHRPRARRRGLPGAAALAASGCGIGAVSAMVSIGGGTMTVPLLAWCGAQMARAIATSAVVGVPIALAGAAGYMISGWERTAALPWHLGFVNVPAALCIAAASFCTAPLGARLAHSLPGAGLKRLFSLITLCLALRMLHTVTA